MSNVSRSVYQKVKEENKRLIADIKIMSQESTTVEKIECILKWREKFKKDDEFIGLLHDVIKGGKL